MALFTLSDLHLSFAAGKPMDIFGPSWENHAERIKKNWLETITPADTVVLPGDLSWGMSLAEALPDFRFLDALPGQKIISKGNHDYFWDTAAKMSKFFEENGITSIKILHNNFFSYGGTAICGTRGWFYEREFADAHDEKIFKRETGRLKASLDAAAGAGFSDLLVFLHYPPICQGREAADIVGLMASYHVLGCYFGHLHGYSHASAFQGFKDGTEYRLVSGDYLDFRPLLIKGP